MSKKKRANFGVIDYDHYGHLVDLGYPIKEADYLFLDQVSNMQKDPRRGFWCTMSNEEFCEKKKMTDSGLRSMQRKLVKLGLLEKQDGNKTGKRATALFFNPTPYSPSKSDERQKVTNTPSKSDEQVRQKVTQSPSKSDDESKEKKYKKKEKKIELPFSSSEFIEAWADWEQHRIEKRKPITPTAKKNQLKKLEAMGEKRAVACLIHSTTQGWEGLYEPKKEDAPKKEIDWKAVHSSPLY